MLARDYTDVGREGSILEQWATEKMVGDIGSIGSDEGDAITISNKSGNVQAWRNETRSRLPGLGRKGRSPGELMQPCQTALSADSTILAVADSGNNRVQLFDTRTREPVASVGTRGQIRPGRMQTPEGVVFVDGRCEMIVADTGNNRLQVFHVDILAGPRGDPGLHAASERSSSGGSRRTFDGLLPSNAIRGTPAAEAVGVVGDGSSRDCLIVFAEGEGVGMLRKRRTAGESEAAEGPLCQPCDLAYWRARPPGRGIDGNTSTWAWTSELPRWFRRHTSHGSLGLPYPDADGEEEAKRELLPPDFTNNIPIPSRGGDENGNEGYSRSGNETTAGLARSFVRGAAGGRRPLLGAFLVRETGIYGKLQLLFVAKTKEAEAAEATSANEEKGDPENDSGPALSEHTSDEDGSESLDWMKKATSGDGLGERRDGEGASGSEAGSSSQLSSTTPLPIYEVRDETITVLDDGTGVDICGRVYDSLLSLLRAFRWGGSERLVGVTDSRGDRGVVAVAERGSGRVRLLHYAPPFPPFYAAELTHLHSIEGLRRPSSVSFSTDGDLLVVDQDARKVLVYCHLSGRWVRVREFGPDEIIHDEDVENANGTDAPSKKSRPGRPAAADKPKRGREPAHESQPLRGPSACLVRTVPPGERPGKGGAAAATLAAAGQGQEKNETAGHAREKQDRADESGGWAGGTPVSARFMNRKVTGLGPCTPPDDDSHRAESTELVVVVASSDGVVRTLRGPSRRHCGSFALLDEGTALSIFELLGYQSSQVLGHVNRTMAGLRSRLRREWRLHPLTPGQLARRTLEFLLWGRSCTGEGLPGRGASVDESGKRLCDRFLATSSCSRPACPYSHDQPWVGAISENSTDACIVFRGGVTHAINNLYGQVFGWEWEGELYRLFLERSFLRTMVARRDPMTLGVHGAEAVRACEEKVGRVLDYPGFVDLLTVVHEHVLGLRSWHQRPVPAATSQPNLLNTRGTTTSRVDDELSTAPHSLVGRHASGGKLPECEGKLGDSASIVKGQRSAHQGEPPPGGKEREREEIGVAPPAKQPTDDTASFAVETKLHQVPSKGDSLTPPLRKLDAATPWLSWDFAAPNDTATREAEYCGSPAAVAAKIQASSGEAWQSGQDAKAEPKDNGSIVSQGRGDKAAQEPKVNRTYGGDGDGNDHGASVNKLFAFQTDRVVRMLDDMF